jgi:histidinol phosphatase-like PHP family hydrolase
MTSDNLENLGRPYPAPWLVRQAHQMGIAFCFGVDSHGPRQVGDGLEDAREYLLDLGVDSITALTREGGSIGRRQISL